MIVPVFSNTHLQQEIDKLKTFKDVLRSMIFLNCGGSIDMTDFWFYPTDEEDHQVNITAYLFDAHRPFHHNNINDASKRIQCIDDGCKSFAECPTNQDIAEFYELLQDEAGSDEEDESSGSEAENAQEA